MRWGNSLVFQIVWSCRKALLALPILVLTYSFIAPCTLMIRHRPGKWRTLHILVDIFFLQDRFGAGCIQIHDFGLLFVYAKGYLRRYSPQSISLVFLSCIFDGCGKVRPHHPQNPGHLTGKIMSTGFRSFSASSSFSWSRLWPARKGKGQQTVLPGTRLDLKMSWKLPFLYYFAGHSLIRDTRLVRIP